MGCALPCYSKSCNSTQSTKTMSDKPNDNQFNTKGGDNPLKDTDSEGDNEEEHERPSIKESIPIL